MNKNLVWLLGALACLASCSLSKDQEQREEWSGNGIFYGATAIHHKTLNEAITIYGALDAEDIMAKEMTIYGAATIEDSTVNGLIEIKGALAAENSHFNKKVTVYGMVGMKDCTAQDIVIKNVPHKEQYQISLKDKTVISGSIIFEHGKGVVYADEEVVIKGEIKGGVRKIAED